MHTGTCLRPNYSTAHTAAAQGSHLVLPAGCNCCPRHAPISLPVGAPSLCHASSDSPGAFTIGLEAPCPSHTIRQAGLHHQGVARRQDSQERLQHGAAHHKQGSLPPHHRLMAAFKVSSRWLAALNRQWQEARVPHCPPAGLGQMPLKRWHTLAQIHQNTQPRERRLPPPKPRNHTPRGASCAAPSGRG